MSTDGFDRVRFDESLELARDQLTLAALDPPDRDRSDVDDEERER